MNVTIKNINHETLKALEVLLNPFVLKDNMQILKQEDDFSLQAISEYEEEKKQGKTVIYDSLEEYKKAMGV